jgi:adenylate cyclase
MSEQATVIFTDLIGSTGLFEKVGNARATQLVTQLTQWIGVVCQSHGGRVVKTMGDGVLAVFPGAQAAVNAVVELQRTHYKSLDDLPPAIRMPMRVGVATGEVEIVNDDCYGDAVNVAARLSDLSGPHQIWVNDLALAGVVEPGGARFRTLGPITIRGRAETVDVSQVEWREDITTDIWTMQGDVGADLEGVDVFGGQITLSYLDIQKTYRSFDLPIHIGRDAQVEFVMADPRVSRSHVRIDWRNGGVVLVDVSTYGTWVRFAGGGSDLLLRREECVLHGQGEIALGAPFSDFSVATVSFAVA